MGVKTRRVLSEGSGQFVANEVAESEFEEFARMIRRWLRREAFDICGDWHEADDLVQVTLWKMYQRWDRLDRRAGLGGYTRRVLVHCFLTERRRPRWRQEVTGLIQTEAHLVSGFQTAVEDRMVLLPALQRLGPRQRAVMTLRYLCDLSVEQTARELGCKPGTVTSQTVRALDALRHHLQI